MSSAKFKTLATMLALVLVWGKYESNAQYGYSAFVDTLILQATSGTVGLTDRQLSGDTSVYINGVLQTISTRHSNYAGNHKAAQFILQEFLSYGLPAELQQYDPNGYNVVAEKTGTVYPDEQFIICAHYDDMPNASVAPGADDNASGVSAVLEAARLLSPYDFDYTLRFIAFDEEEQGLFGSWAYADTAYKYGVVIKGVINLDMIAWDGNDDYEMSVGANENSMTLLCDFTDILRIFTPQFSTHLIISTASDHARFWNKGYKAVHAIEEYPGDFNPYYHQNTDIFDNIDMPFFLAATRGAAAALATMGKDYRMTMSHQPLDNNRSTADRNVSVVITSPKSLNITNYKPRLYYKIDNSDFDYLLPSQIAGDTFKFVVPGQAPGTKISYYFAAQDNNNEFSVTLPEYGKGINPPGSVPPPSFYHYYILNDTTVTYCASGLPLLIPAYSTTFKTVTVTNAGRILDLNVNLSLNHTNDKDINLYLVSPTGRQVMLSTKNGISLDNYTNTVFDDEALIYIQQGRPPYTGSFRPEQMLSAYDDTLSNGNWSLKIVNAGGTSGSLTNLCLSTTYARSDYYVDASRAVSGNGLSWPTAFKTISEAALLNPAAGSMVYIKPGEYNEAITITSNGQEIVPLKTGIILTYPDTVKFPAGTNLSGINLVNNPGEYYVSVFRSLNYNNGAYQVRKVNDAGDYVLVNGVEFFPETGILTDSARLSACVFRPVIYRKYSQNPSVERVVADADANPLITQMMYIGDSIGDGSIDALPASYNMIDGIDLTGSVNGGGVKIQSSSFNVISNSRIFELDGPGVAISGNANHPAYYNLILDNEIFNTPPEAFTAGIAGMPANLNHAHFSHLVDNEIYTSGTGNNAFLNKAFEINGFNNGTLVSANIIRDFDLASDAAAIEAGSGSDCSVISGNWMKNIGSGGSGTNSLIRINADSDSIWIFNNILYDSLIMNDDIYAFHINGTGHHNSYLIHNTVYNLDNGFLLEDYGDSSPGFNILNNAIVINGDYFNNQGIGGRFGINHNFYNNVPVTLPGLPYYTETGRQVGAPEFAGPQTGDFRPTIKSDPLICNGLNLTLPFNLDPGWNLRDSNMPDIGAFELENKIAWTGEVDENWSTAGNWSKNAIPVSLNNVVILLSENNPVLDIDGELKGLLLKNGTKIFIRQGKSLLQNQ